VARSRGDLDGSVSPVSSLAIELDDGDAWLIGDAQRGSGGPPGSSNRNGTTMPSRMRLEKAIS
jgi:hypothetical protein